MDGSSIHYERFIDGLNLHSTRHPGAIKKDRSVTIPQIREFVEMNKKLDLKINILGLENNQVFVFENEIGKNGKNVLNLLSVPLKALDGSDAIEEHLLEITNLKNFLCERYGQSGNYSYKVREICTNCLNGFENISALKDHQLICWNKRAQIEIMPEPGETLSFQNHRKKFKTPIIGALDFETVITGSSADENVLSPVQYSLIFFDKTGKLLYEKRETCEKGMAGKKLINTLLDIEPRLLRQLNRDLMKERKQTLDDITTEEDRKRMGKQKYCIICDEPLGNDRVRDHDHYDATINGLAHSDCNFNRQTAQRISIYCHNGSSFDFQFLLNEAFANDPRIKKRDALPYNLEKFRIIDINSYTLKDSYAFLGTSLDAAVEDLKKRKPNYEFGLLRQSKVCLDENGVFDNRRFEMLKHGKSMLPYDRLTLKYMKKTKKVPPKSHYYSKLKETEISDEDYKNIKKFWKVFKCKNIMDYSSSYVMSDTLLLASCIEEFRDNIWSFSGLDSDQYIGLPG